MRCPKCQAENQFQNFCNNCGNTLKMECLKCGKMEEIGLAYYETEKNNFLTKYADSFGAYKLIIRGGSIVLLLGWIIAFGATIFESKIYFLLGLLIIFSGSYLIFIAFSAKDKQRKRAEKIFEEISFKMSTGQ